MEQMDSQKRISMALEHQEADRIPITDTCYWPKTIERWENEGLPKGMHPNDYFEMDQIYCNSPFDCSLANIFPHKVYEETEEYKIELNYLGVKNKCWKNRYANHI